MQQRRIGSGGEGFVSEEMSPTEGLRVILVIFSDKLPSVRLNYSVGSQA